MEGASRSLRGISTATVQASGGRGGGPEAHEKHVYVPGGEQTRQTRSRTKSSEHSFELDMAIQEPEAQRSEETFREPGARRRGQRLHHLLPCGPSTSEMLRRHSIRTAPPRGKGPFTQAGAPAAPSWHVPPLGRGSGSAWPAPWKAARRGCGFIGGFLSAPPLCCVVMGKCSVHVIQQPVMPPRAWLEKAGFPVRTRELFNTST